VRIAALYDIHGNLPALDAVLADVSRSGADTIVVGGDVVPGPMPRESLERLLDLDLPVRFIHGNCERSVLAQIAGQRTGTVTYWGTVSGNPLPPEDLENMRWTAHELGPDVEPLFAAWPRTLRLRVDGLGDVVFCHATPRSETEVFTRRTADERLRPLFDGLGAAVVLCGHTHMQADRSVGRTRVVNAGSVGAPYGEPAACWALLGPGLELRRTGYDVAAAARRIRASAYPGRDSYAAQLLAPPAEDAMLDLFSRFELT